MNNFKIKRQQGFAMMEVSLALIITAFAVMGTIKASAQTQKLELAGIQGDGLRIARDAGEAYAQENYTALQNGSPITKNGVTLTAGTALGQTYRPTAANLIALGYLSTGFSVDGSFSNGQAPGTYQFKLAPTPAGCVAGACDISGLVYLDKPIVAAGSTDPDGPAMSAIASKIGGNAGFTMLPLPTQLTGMGGAWTMNNPLPGNPAGVVAARFGFGSSGLNNLVRINDTRDPNLQGDLSVAGTTTGHGNVGTSDGVAACLRAAMQTDGQIVARATNCLVSAYMDPNSATIGVNNAAGNTTVAMDGNSGSLTASGNLTAGGNINAGGAMVASQIYSNGEATTAGWFRTTGDTGWYSEKWNGGVHMSDGQWVRSYADKGIYTGGQMQAGSLQSNSDLNVARNSSVAGNQTVGSQTVYGQQNIGGSQVIGGSQLVQGNVAVTNAVIPGQIASNGAYCGGNAGAIARDGNNNLYICN